MSNLIEYDGFWSRFDAGWDDDHNYLYGCNELRKGTGGQACLRGLPNAYGIRTKKYPMMTSDSFWSDDDYEKNCRMIDEDLDAVPLNKDVYISENGLGTGLAKLDQKAPRTYRYLLKRLRQFECDLNNYSVGGQLE